ncbi:MAG TPA: response regulator [Candidatus Limnocylindria bacterium]|nr:response regulator [Candidatus Limnocylindria bacterium]
MSKQKIILFVDDDASFLELIGELMQQASAGGWQVIMADNPAKALASLKEFNFDMIVVDERMPIMSGLQFVRLARGRFPHVPIVVLTGYAEERTRDQLIREGIEVLLEKPTSSEGFHTLFLTLHQLLELERQQGFRGVMHDVELQDILQIECLRRNSSVLEVFSKSEVGEIFIRTGAIVHAAVGILSGEPAFHHLVNLKDGEFRLKPYQEPPAQTISLKWETLLMEAAQLRDEVAGSSTAASIEEPTLAASADAAFPPVELTEEERAAALTPRNFVAVSIEGRILAGSTHDAQNVPAQLAALLRDAEWFKTAAGLGALELFEASTPAREAVMHFQPESVFFVTQSRRNAA